MQKGIILFDIDRTICDTDKLSNSFNEKILEVLNTTDLDTIKEVKNEYHKSLGNQREYVPEVALKLIAQKLSFPDLEKLEEVYYGEKYEYLYKDAIYPEFFEVIKKLEGYRLGVYSEGTKRFQNRKFDAMDIRKYFDPELIFIVDAKDTPEMIRKIPKGSTIVDDKESICEFLTSNGIRAVWLNKKDEGVSDKFETIHNLPELLDLLAIKP